MKINPVTQRFTGSDSHLESGFQQHFFKLSLPVFRWGFLLGIFFYSIFGILDAVVMPTVRYELWKIRYGIVVPVLASGIAFSFYPGFQRYWQAAISFLVSVAAFGIMYMILIGPYPYNTVYYVGVILVLIFYYALIRTRFVWSLFTGLVILFAFELTLLLAHMPLRIILSSNFFFVSSFLIGLIACYSSEYFARENYYLMVQIDDEKKRYAVVNESLHQKIMDLEEARAQISVLSGLLPICAGCKKIRDDKGYWIQIENYIAEHSDAVFSHAMCPECMEKFYGHEKWFNIKNQQDAPRT